MEVMEALMEKKMADEVREMELCDDTRVLATGNHAHVDKRSKAKVPRRQSVMAPIRRYLRISKNSVLECRIFLENPADTQRWLLSPSNPALPRVIAAVKPMVLPKLREENERIKGKGKKRRVVKDVVKGGQ